MGDRGEPAKGAGPTLVIRGGTVVDQSGGHRADVLIAEGRVAAVESRIARPRGATVLEADGCVVAPGLVDLHTHLREPGREESETIETGTRAASLGGFTAVVAMPNTEPALDSAEAVRNVQELAVGASAHVAVAGAITVGRAGERLAPMSELAALGVRIFTDDGAGVQSAGLMRRALDYATGLGVTLAQHCEDRTLAGDGAMHEGAWSSRLGIPGMPAAAEEVMVARDIALVRALGTRIHFLHLSTAVSVDLVRRAKSEGLAVTAEAAPHHFSLTDGCTADYDPVFKVNPPLRTAADVTALRAALAEGVIDAVATDHAPHTVEDKECEWAYARPGMLGLETALSVVLSTGALAGDAGTDWDALAQRMSRTPARIAGLDGHGRDPAVGVPANLTLVDPAATTTVEPGASASRSRNNPYTGRTLPGRIVATFLRGEPTVLDGKATR